MSIDQKTFTSDRQRRKIEQAVNIMQKHTIYQKKSSSHSKKSRKIKKTHHPSRINQDDLNEENLAFQTSQATDKNHQEGDSKCLKEEQKDPLNLDYPLNGKTLFDYLKQYNNLQINKLAQKQTHLEKIGQKQQCIQIDKYQSSEKIVQDVEKAITQMKHLPKLFSKVVLKAGRQILVQR